MAHTKQSDPLRKVNKKIDLRDVHWSYSYDGLLVYILSNSSKSSYDGILVVFLYAVIFRSAEPYTQ